MQHRRHGRSSLTDPLVLRWAALLLVTRVALVSIAVTLLRGGPFDPSRDLIYHFQLAEVPLNHLLRPVLPQYPPLLGLAEAVTYRPWRMLGASPASALRFGAVVWDVVAGWLVFAAMSVACRPRLPRAALLYTALPLTWMASAIFGQDEVIGAAFIAAGLWSLALERRHQARVLGVAGLFVAKLLVLPLLVALVLVRPRVERRREAALALTTAMVVAAVLWLLTGNDGLSGQLGYKPEWITFSVTPWGWLVGNGDVASGTAQVTGQVLAALAVAAVLGLLLRHRRIRGDAEGTAAAPETLQVAGMTAALLLAAFGFLAVMNPEYVALAAPALVVAAARWDAAWLAALAAVPWLTDTVFAVIRRGPEQSWPVFGDFTVDPARFDQLSWLHMSLAIATTSVLVVHAVRLARRGGGAGDTAAGDSVAAAVPGDAAPDVPVGALAEELAG